MGFNERYERILAEVETCCQKAGRDPRKVRVLAVSKTVGISEVAAAIGAGVQDFGENRPDALKEKAKAFPKQTWHFIGNIQSRRIADIVTYSQLIHSVYQEHHLSKIDAAAKAIGKVQDILIEVNISGETSKSGLGSKDVKDMLTACAGFPNIRVRGLMTMAPQGDPAFAKECFESLARLRDVLRNDLDARQAFIFDELSMGMSEDWREAVGAGATIVRIGRALFDDKFEATRT